MLVIFLVPFLLRVIVMTFQKFLLKEEMAIVQCFEFGMCLGMFGRKCIYYILENYILYVSDS